MKVVRRDLEWGCRDAACVACEYDRDLFEVTHEEGDRGRFFFETGDQVCIACVEEGANYITAKLLERAEEHRRIAARYEAAAQGSVWIPEHYQREATAKMEQLRAKRRAWVERERASSKRSRVTNPWRLWIHRSEELVLSHYYERINDYWNRRTDLDSWLAVQCNRSSDWNPRPSSGP